jgi:hypothetical protein
VDPYSNFCFRTYSETQVSEVEFASSKLFTLKVNFEKPQKDA